MYREVNPLALAIVTILVVFFSILMLYIAMSIPHIPAEKWRVFEILVLLAVLSFVVSLALF